MNRRRSLLATAMALILALAGTGCLGPSPEEEATQEAVTVARQVRKDLAGMAGNSVTPEQLQGKITRYAKPNSGFVVVTTTPDDTGVTVHAYTTGTGGGQGPLDSGWGYVMACFRTRLLPATKAAELTGEKCLPEAEAAFRDEHGSVVAQPLPAL